MALVVFLRGVNVGGHRRFRPAALASQLVHLGVVNVGAAGTLIVRRPVTRKELRAELVRRLPFDAEVAICEGRQMTIGEDGTAPSYPWREAVRASPVFPS